MKNFRKNLMASEDVKAWVKSGRFYDAQDALAECHDGAFVVEGALEDHAVYTGLKDFNVRKITAPANATDEVVVVDYAGRSEGEINSVLYREGTKTAGLSAPAGQNVRYRKLQIGDSFWLGEDNFVSGEAAGKYAYPTAASTLLTVDTTPNASSTNVYIELAQNLITGAINDGKEYLCTVVSLA